MLHEMQEAYSKKEAGNVDALCQSLFGSNEEPLVIGAGSDEWFFGLNEVKRLFLSDWASWGDVSLNFDTLRHELVDGRGWFVVRGGVVYQFSDSTETDSRFIRLSREISGQDKPAVARAGDILWLLSHLLHRRGSSPRKYLWRFTLSGMFEGFGGVDPELNIQSLQFALPADSTYPDDRIGKVGWERDSYEKVSALIAEWREARKGESCRFEQALSRWHKDDGGIEWLADGQKRFMGFDGEMRDSDNFLTQLRVLKDRWQIDLQPQNLMVREESGMVRFYGLGLLQRQLLLDKELNYVLERIQSGAYGDDGKDTLFRIRRDLCRVLKEAGTGGDMVTPYRVEGLGDVVGHRLFMRYFHLSAPYSYVLEQKTDDAEVS